MGGHHVLGGGNLILSYLLGLFCGIGWRHLKTRRSKYSSLFASLLVIASNLLIAWASTYAELPLSFPFWVGWPPRYVSIPETALVSVNFFNKPLIITAYGTPFGPPYHSAMLILFVHMCVINVIAGFSGLATIIIPYTYWMYYEIRRRK